MYKKITLILLLLWVSSQLAFADVFKPVVEEYKYSIESYMRDCRVDSIEKLPTSTCDFATTDSELIKRINTVNWYYDFDVIMRFRMFKEIVWDLPYTEEEMAERIDLDRQLGIRDTNFNKWKDGAYKIITELSSSFDSWANSFIRDRNDNEVEFKEGILSSIHSKSVRLQKYNVEWYKELDNFRKKKIEDETFWFTDPMYDDLYLSNIDEISSMYEDNYPNDDNVGIYFPNVKRYLQLRKEWTTFYRDFSDWPETSYDRQWYSNNERTKAKAWEYTNSYDKKVDYEYTITQTIWDNILNENGWNYVHKEVVKEISKLEMYSKKWNKAKNFEKDYKLVYNITLNFVKKLKSKYSSTKVKSKLTILSERITPLIVKFENKYNQEKNIKLKWKYQQYVWLLLIFEKVLSENNF